MERADVTVADGGGGDGEARGEPASESHRHQPRHPWSRTPMAPPWRSSAVQLLWIGGPASGAFGFLSSSSFEASSARFPIGGVGLGLERENRLAAGGASG
ncbi:LRRNT_2 domain-containing protein [Psidium guajava]|nr:LRRNT_2 domain-containing protein [Psidium guajava]